MSKQRFKNEVLLHYKTWSDPYLDQVLRLDDLFDRVRYSGPTLDGKGITVREEASHPYGTMYTLSNRMLIHFVEKQLNVAVMELSIETRVVEITSPPEEEEVPVQPQPEEPEVKRFRKIKL